MKTLEQQVSSCVKHYKRWSRVSVIDFIDSRYLVLWQSLVYSNKLIQEITFELAELLESKIESTSKSKVNKDILKSTIQTFLIDATEVKKEDFSKYSLDWDITFIEWDEYWISTSWLIWALNLLKGVVCLKIFIKNWLIWFADEYDNLLMIIWMLKLQESLF